MDMTLVPNYQGELVLYRRMVNWSKNREEVVELVAEDGASISVSRAAFQFFSNLAGEEKFDVVFTPISSQMLAVIGDILNFKNKETGLESEEDFQLIRDNMDYLNS